jgi:hypothetical protein
MVSINSLITIEERETANLMVSGVVLVVGIESVSGSASLAVLPGIENVESRLVMASWGGVTGLWPSVIDSLVELLLHAAIASKTASRRVGSNACRKIKAILNPKSGWPSVGINPMAQKNRGQSWSSQEWLLNDKVR